MKELLSIGYALRDRYEIRAVLGQERLSAIYRATDREGFGRPCLVKEFVPESAGDAATRSVFEREARILAELSHPGIPRLLAFFSEGGRYYLVEERVEGQTLKDLVRSRGPLPEAEVLAVLEGSLDILAYLHGRSPAVIHRAIRPSSLIRTGAGTLFLTDFGSVREAATRTALATVLESPSAYTPPEQLRGEPHPASDLYALGATALYLLTSHEPDKFFDTSRGEWRLDEGVKAGSRFRAILEKMLAVSVGTRYQSAEEVLADLRRPPEPAVVTPTEAATAVIGEATLRQPTPSPRVPEPTVTAAEPQHEMVTGAQPRWSGLARHKMKYLALLLGVGILSAVFSGKDDAPTPPPQPPDGTGGGWSETGTPPGVSQPGSPPGLPPVSPPAVEAARRQLTRTVTIPLLASGRGVGSLTVRYPQGWLPEQGENMISVWHPDRNSAFQVGPQQIPGFYQSPDELLQALMPQIQQYSQSQGMQDLRLVNSVPGSGGKGYIFTWMRGGRRFMSYLEFTIVHSAPPINAPYLPGVPSPYGVPGVTSFMYVGLVGIPENNPQSRLPLLVAMASSWGGKGLGPGTHDWKGSGSGDDIQRRCEEEAWGYSKERYVGQGGGNPDPRWYSDALQRCLARHGR